MVAEAGVVGGGDEEGIVSLLIRLVNYSQATLTGHRLVNAHKHKYVRAHRDSNPGQLRGWLPGRYTSLVPGFSLSGVEKIC